MFDDLRAAFREAIDNFNKELSREQVPETVDKLIVGMKNEIAEAKVQIGDLENHIAKSRKSMAKERSEAATCRRREQMAREISDTETAELAAQYADKHEEHVRLLEQKITALEAELNFRGEEVDEMLGRVKEARAKRESLSATAGRSGARETIGGADDLFSELDRMAEKIQGEEAKGEAAEAMGVVDFDDPLDTHIRSEPPPPIDVDYDARLEELKRRMEKGQA
jgi:phage shock protein A